MRKRHVATGLTDTIELLESQGEAELHLLAVESGLTIALITTGIQAHVKAACGTTADISTLPINSRADIRLLVRLR